MNKLLALFFIISFGYSNAQVKSLEPADFYNETKNNNSLQLLDLRSDSDFRDGHIKKAVNYDYNDDGFETYVLFKFDKKTPLYIYCYTGTRSAEAKNYLKELGFTTVVELQGGFSNWTRSSKPYVSSRIFTTPIAPFTMADLEREIKTNKTLLVDFYATWCGPCKKMKPILQKVGADNPNVKLIQIDAEKSEDISSLFAVREIPTLVLFKNGKQVWRGSGVMTEKEVKKLVQ